MADRRSEAVIPPAPQSTDHPSAAAATGNYAAIDQEPEDIQRDIQRTRAEMSETIDALGQRLNPGYIKDQVKDSVRETAHDAGTSMLDTIKENPIPALVAGLSVGWLIMSAGRSDHDYDYDEQGRRYYRPRSARAYAPYPTSAYPGRGYERYETGYDGDQSMTDKAQQKAGDMADEARQKAEGAVDRLGDIAGSAAHQAQDLGHEAQYYGRRATNWLERTMEDNPVAMGALALAAGALVGLAVPGTRQEDRWMGHASENLVEKAKSAAQEKMEQVKDVVKETAEDAKEHAKDVAQDAKQHAKEHDLDEPPKTMQSGSSGSGSSTSVASGRTTVGTTPAPGTPLSATPVNSGSPSSGATSGKTGGTTSNQGKNRDR